MHTSTAGNNSKELNVSMVNQVLTKEGFTLRRGDARKVISSLTGTSRESICQAALELGLKRADTPRRTFDSNVIQLESLQEKTESVDQELIDYLCAEAFGTLTNEASEERFLELIAEEAAEGTETRMLEVSRDEELYWVVEDTHRPHLLTEGTVGEFMAKPAADYSYPVETMQDEDVLLLAGEIIEELFSEVIEHTIDKAREYAPEGIKRLIPAPQNIGLCEELEDLVFDALSTEPDADGIAAKLGKLSQLSLKEVVLKFRPEMTESFAKGAKSLRLKAEALSAAELRAPEKIEAIRKELLGENGRRLARKDVPRAINRIIGEVDSLEGLFLALEVLQAERVVSCIDRTGEPLFMEYVNSVLAAFDKFPVMLGHPLAKLFFSLNQERSRSGKRFTVTALEGNGMLSKFDEERWAYFMAWALTGALASDSPRRSLVVRREENMRAAASGQAIQSVAGMLLEGLEVKALNAEEMRLAQNVDAETGEALEPEPGVRCIDFNKMCPDLFKNEETFEQH